MAAKGRRDKHASKTKVEDDGVVCIACDYGFFTSKDDEDKDEEELEKRYTPLLIAVDDSSKTVLGSVVHRKGVDDWSEKVLVDFVVDLGYPKVKLRSDGEKSIKALLATVSRELKKKGVTVVPDRTPEGDSQAGGLQESAVKTVKDMTRCL